MAITYTVTMPDAETRDTIRDGISRLTRALGYSAVHALLSDIASGKLTVAPAALPTGEGAWVAIARLTEGAECAECFAKLEVGRAYAEIMSDGTLNSAVCDICAVH